MQKVVIKKPQQKQQKIGIQIIILFFYQHFSKYKIFLIKSQYPQNVVDKL